MAGHTRGLSGEESGWLDSHQRSPTSEVGGLTKLSHTQVIHRELGRI